MQFHFEQRDDSEDEYWKRWYHRPFAWMIGIGKDLSCTVAVIRGVCICMTFLLGTDMLLMAIGINLSPLWIPFVPFLLCFYVLFTNPPLS